MSRHQQEQTTAIRQNIAMACAGFLMASTIIGAGLAGYALGRQVAPAPTAAPFAARGRARPLVVRPAQPRPTATGWP